MSSSQARYGLRKGSKGRNRWWQVEDMLLKKMLRRPIQRRKVREARVKKICGGGHE